MVLPAANATLAAFPAGAGGSQEGTPGSVFLHTSSYATSREVDSGLGR
jgi:hypothetical protein